MIAPVRCPRCGWCLWGELRKWGAGAVSFHCWRCQRWVRWERAK